MIKLVNFKKFARPHPPVNTVTLPRLEKHPNMLILGEGSTVKLVNKSRD